MGIFHVNEVKRHKAKNLDLMERDRKFQLKAIDRFLPKVADETFLLTSLGLHSQNLVTHLLYRHRDATEIIKYLTLSHHARTWHQVGLHHDGPHHVKLPGIEAFTCGPMEGNIDVDLSAWMDGIELAAIFRDRAALDVYLDVPFLLLEKRGGIKVDSYFYPFMKLLKAAWNGDDKWMEYGMEILDLIEAAQMTGLRKIVIETFLLTYLNLWWAALKGDEDLFNKNLKHRLITCKKRYLANDKNRNEIKNFVDYPALSVLAYVHDAGMEVKVKSDYIPEFLWKGDFDKLTWPME